MGIGDWCSFPPAKGFCAAHLGRASLDSGGLRSFTAEPHAALIGGSSLRARLWILDVAVPWCGARRPPDTRSVSDLVNASNWRPSEFGPPLGTQTSSSGPVNGDHGSAIYHRSICDELREGVKQQ